MVLLILWQISIVAQGLLAYGTVYRLTKHGGDNGVALFGWLLVLGLASLIPGLGVYLWYHYKDENYDKHHHHHHRQHHRHHQQTCGIDPTERNVY